MKENEKILKRIIDNIGEKVFTELSESFTTGDLQSLLMHVFDERLRGASPAKILSEYSNNRFVRRSDIPQRKIIEFDQLAFSLLPEYFETIELSPVAPLGSVSSFARVHQNNVVSTIRNSEVVSDPTNLLAIECALRRRKMSPAERSALRINLASSHRVVRAQFFEGPVSFAHFRLFTMVTAGRDIGSNIFEKDSLWEHVYWYLCFFQELKKKNYSFEKIHTHFFLLDKDPGKRLSDSFINKLSENFPEVEFTIDSNNSNANNYYKSIRFQISFEFGNEKILIVDGGFTDWTEQLLSDKKERLLISGFGTDRIILCFNK